MNAIESNKIGIQLHWRNVCILFIDGNKLAHTRKKTRSQDSIFFCSRTWTNQPFNILWTSAVCIQSHNPSIVDGMVHYYYYYYSKYASRRKQSNITVITVDIYGTKAWHAGKYGLSAMCVRFYDLIFKAVRRTLRKCVIPLRFKVCE